MFKGNSVLLICDDEALSRSIRDELVTEKGYSVSCESSGNGGIAALRQNQFDLVIAKFGVADMRGGELVIGLKKACTDCTVVCLIEEAAPELLEQLSDLGVYDFINAPVCADKLCTVTKKGIEMHSVVLTHQKLTQSLKERNDALEKQNLLLAKRIEDSTKNLTRLYEDLRSTYMRTIKVLAQAIDARDHYTHSHSENVAKYAVAIAEELKLSANVVEIIREACELHDLGKIGIEDHILTKTSDLDDAEWEQIKRHPLIAAKILEPLTFLNEVIGLVSQHHEHYDGSGYPEGRRGEHILLGARIIHLADAYEAMSSARSYRQVPFNKERAIEEIKKNSGTQFDPVVVEAFLRIVDKL